MRSLLAFSLFLLTCLDSFANSLALPLRNITNTLSDLNINASFVLDEGHYFRIPGTPLTLHLTLVPPKTSLPVETTLICLHKFAKALSSEPPSKYLDRMREQTLHNVEAIISPAHCPGCGITYRESCKVLAGLWVYTSREKLLYAQRYGVFEERTKRMVAWGTLLMAPPAPGVSGGLDMVSI